MKEKNKTFFWIYFVFVIIFAFLGLFDSVVSFSAPFFIEILPYSFLMVPVSFFMFVLSIVALVIFLREKQPGLVLVLPVYHISLFLLSFMVGFVLGVIFAIKGLDITKMFVPACAGYFSLITSLFELVFGFYVMYRFR